MYDFYPEWGPARHRDDPQPQPAQRRPRYWGATATVARDDESEQPEDN
jgi:hypothetical protein